MSNNYVCSQHIEIEVTWKGKGCELCAKEKKEWRDKHKKNKYN